EFDYDAGGNAAALFERDYLATGQNNAHPIKYPYYFAPPVNTGVPSHADLDANGRVEEQPGSRGYGNDAFGFGQFPGQYGMVLYSKFPIDTANVRLLGALLWKDMPGALMPTKPDGSSWYSADAQKVFRLSSKNHCDIPITIGSRTVHVLASHPTPPAFDGPEQ